MPAETCRQAVGIPALTGHQTVFQLARLGLTGAHQAVTGGLPRLLTTGLSGIGLPDALTYLQALFNRIQPQGGQPGVTGAGFQHHDRAYNQQHAGTDNHPDHELISSSSSQRSSRASRSASAASRSASNRITAAYSRHYNTRTEEH